MQRRMRTGEQHCAVTQCFVRRASSAWSSRLWIFELLSRRIVPSMSSRQKRSGHVSRPVRSRSPWRSWPGRLRMCCSKRVWRTSRVLSPQSRPSVAQGSSTLLTASYSLKTSSVTRRFFVKTVSAAQQRSSLKSRPDSKWSRLPARSPTSSWSNVSTRRLPRPRTITPQSARHVKFQRQTPWKHGKGASANCSSCSTGTEKMPPIATNRFSNNSNKSTTTA
mmetsp:Transcript_58027/g.103809  ORF Transcript_58027/g.103809 Transcript_58027/m.103809 type:complete len:221 (+) Transcript_58027:2807-3469(+)